MPEISAEQQSTLITTLQSRFENNMSRHPYIKWTQVQEKVVRKAEALWSLFEMERTGGEPDVVAFASKAKEFVFVDCSPESPHGRRSFCYDRKAWEKRKKHKPKNTVLDVVAEMGVELVSEAQYRQLQQLGEFDTKTSSWIKTPVEIRERGGALFADRRYGQVFVYHNGADSYYASRGFRAALFV